MKGLVSMSEIKTLKVAVRDAFSAMESASAALDAVDGDAPDTNVEELEAAFVAAERSHEVAVEKLERAEKLVSARGALPVEPAADTSEVVEERGVKVGKQELVYRADFGSASFFHDVYDATKGDSRASERLAAHHKQVSEERASTGINSTDTSGGEFVPPIWLLDEYVKVARAGRPTANAVNRRPLPPGTDSINLPKITSGTAVAAQQDLGTITPTDPVTSSVSIPVITQAGNQDLSRQAFERSAAAGAGLEQILGEDLLAEYAKQVDVQVLSGSGSSGQAQGIVNVSSPNTVAYTTSSPVVAGSATAADNLYSKIANAIQLVHANRFLPPSAIIMHPRRFAWITAAADTTGRPLVSPLATAVNPAGILGDVASENIVGQIQGVPVIVDANIPTNTGAGTNQDTIIVTRLEDQYLFESAPVVRVFEQALTSTAAIRLQIFGYLAFTAARYAKSTSLITGTGLVTPSF